jgi:hypothetical protein
MNVFEKTFLEILADLSRYLASHGDTNVPRNYATSGGIMLVN